MKRAVNDRAYGCSVCLHKRNYTMESDEVDKQESEGLVLKSALLRTMTMALGRPTICSNTTRSTIS